MPTDLGEILMDEYSRDCLNQTLAMFVFEFGTAMSDKLQFVAIIVKDLLKGVE